MKKSLFLLFVLLAFAALLLAEIKIGVINPQQVLASTIKGKQVIEKLKNMEAQKKKEYDNIQKRISDLEKELMSPALNAETRDKKNLELTNKRTELQRFGEDAQRDLINNQQKEFDEMKKELMPIIEKIAKENNYTIIFDVNTAGIAYVDTATDVTDRVIKAYDAKYSGSASTGKPK